MPIDSPQIESVDGSVMLALRRRDGDDLHLSMEGGRGSSWGKSTLEFCNNGAGGGSSLFTRLALRNLFGIDRQPDARLVQAVEGISPPVTVTRYDDMAPQSHLTLRQSAAGFGVLLFADRSSMGLSNDRLVACFNTHNAPLALLQKAMHVDNLQRPQLNREQAHLHR